ncbi:synapsin-2-like isoform X2 [Acropora muricata]|uniref:synapsin-2-like isoform X2 n=1 Tax=Acropora millepora TaxID=45264 RepID=UPI0010FC96BF|nr:synapsin-2-like isoform X2 [Acropora millepora]
MEFLQKLKISGGVNLSNIRLSRDNERPSTGPNSPTKQRNEPKDDESLPPRGSPAAKKMKILLVIDSPDTDWAKIFKGRKLHGGVYDVRVEQAEFGDLNLASYSDSGTMVDIQVYREGTVVVRSFRPDFVLIRQSVRGIGPREDYRNILLGLQFGNVPSINSLTSIYNFAEKPWVFAQLIRLQKRLGKEEFPLVEQAYYPNYKEMLITPKFPVVVKVGHANGGYGKVCVPNHRSFQDIASIVAISDTYATTEPFIPGKCDIRIQKIGNHYRAFKRTSLSDNWKTNTGSAVLEEITLTDRYKMWVDECSKLFGGGLDIMCVEAIVGKDNKEFIIEVNDTAMRLFSDTQDEDQKRIADLVVERMEREYSPTLEPKTATGAALTGAFKVIGSPGSPTVSEGATAKTEKKKNGGIFSGFID